MRPLLVSLPDGFHLHGFLDTGIAARLVAGADAGCRFLVPPGAEVCVPPPLRSGAGWLAFDRVRRPGLERALHYLRMEASALRRPGSDWAIVRRRHAGHRAWKAGLRLAALLLARAPGLDAALARLEAALAPLRIPGLGEPGPDALLVFGSAGIKQLDASLAYHLRLRSPGARRYGVVYSWDNLSTKFNGLLRFDRLAVWNQAMREEAVAGFGYREDQVAVVGPAQFDVYHDFAPGAPREAFLGKLGLPADARYVLYAGVPPQTTPWNAAYVRALLAALPDHHVVARIHPQDDPARWGELADSPRVRVVDAARAGDGALRRLGFWLPEPEQGRRLAEQIHFADAVVNIASTVTLEALLLDRPVLNLAYDVEPGGFPVAMAEYYAMRHYAPVTASGAVRLVHSEDELRDALRSLDRWWPETAPARERFVRWIDPFRDGGAARRLADDVLAAARRD